MTRVELAKAPQALNSESLPSQAIDPDLSETALSPAPLPVDRAAFEAKRLELLEKPRIELQARMRSLLDQSDFDLQVRPHIFSLMVGTSTTECSTWTDNQLAAVVSVLAFHSLVPHGTVLPNNLRDYRSALAPVRAQILALESNPSGLDAFDARRAKEITARLDSGEILSRAEFSQYSAFFNTLAEKRQLVAELDRAKARILDCVPESLPTAWSQYFVQLGEIWTTKTAHIALNVHFLSRSSSFVRRALSEAEPKVAADCVNRIVDSVLECAKQHTDLPLPLLTLVGLLARYNEPRVVEFLGNMLTRTYGYGLDPSAAPIKVRAFCKHLLAEHSTFLPHLEEFVEVASYLRRIPTQRDIFRALLPSVPAARDQAGLITEASVCSRIGTVEQESGAVLAALCRQILKQQPGTSADAIAFKGDFWKVEFGVQALDTLKGECGSSPSLHDLAENCERLELVVQSCELDPFEGLKIFVTTKSRWQHSLLSGNGFVQWLHERIGCVEPEQPLIRSELTARYRQLRAQLYELAPQVLTYGMSASHKDAEYCRTALVRSIDNYHTSGGSEGQDRKRMRALPINRAELRPVLEALEVPAELRERFTNLYRQLGCFVRAS